MFPLLSAAQAAEATETGVRAGLSVIESGVLGALLVLSVGLNVWVIATLIKLQNSRIDDKTSDSKRIESLNEKLITAFSGMKNSLDNVNETSKAAASGLQAVKNSIDNVILLAVQGRASQLHNPPGE